LPGFGGRHSVKVEHPPLRGHDALDDALSVTYAIQHLLKAGKLAPDVFDRLQPR